MHPLDLLSESPRFFIFKKEANKTNFGGVLFLIYIIIDIIIATYYLINYIKNDKYEIEYSLYVNSSPSNEDNNEIYKELLNPNMNLSFLLFSHGNNKRLKLFDMKKYDFINISDYRRYTRLEKRLNDFFLDVLYECENENCTNESEENIAEQPFEFTLFYEYFSIDFQSNSNIFNKKKSHITNYFFYHNKTNVYNNWHNIIIKEKKGFFQKEDIEGCGYFDSVEKVVSKEDIFQWEVDHKWYKLLMSWQIINTNSKITEYKRRRVSLVTIGANILSYFSNLFFIFKFIFKFYSKHFENYKIIENMYINKNNEILYDNDEQNEESKINKKDKNLNNQFEFSNFELELEKKNINDNNLNDINNKFIDKKENKFLKLNFIHFFLHNIYFKCCNKYNSQEIISISNEILFKYCSVDSILYNQIMLENLFKDYIWNNPSLKNLNNNQLIIKLNNLIKT